MNLSYYIVIIGAGFARTIAVESPQREARGLETESVTRRGAPK